jgi:broad specificity phosphatase PhoE
MLFAVRHGQSESDATGLLIGRTDSPLTELGQRQAISLGDALA